MNVFSFARHFKYVHLITLIHPEIIEVTRAEAIVGNFGDRPIKKREQKDPRVNIRQQSKSDIGFLWTVLAENAFGRTFIISATDEKKYKNSIKCERVEVLMNKH